MPGAESEDADLTRCTHRRKRLLKFNRYWDGSTEAVWECLNPDCKEHLLDHDAP